MDDENGLQIDLWGEPGRPPRDPRGRKRHRYMPQVAERIGLLKAAGWTEDAIAVSVGVSVPTMRKYYFRALSDGADLVRATVLQTLLDKAKDGNVSAAKALDDMLRAAELRGPKSRRLANDEVKPAKLGKKEAADQAAQTAEEGTSWGSLLAH